MIDICPKCKNKSYIKLPSIRIMDEKLGLLLHIQNKYTWKCHNKKCKYESESIIEDTDLGLWLKLPLWKRLFIKI